MTEEEKLLELDRLRLEEGYTLVLRINEYEYAALYRLLYHWTIRRGTIEYVHGFDDGWCYTADGNAALNYLLEWQSRNFEGEPAGWQRHPRTGRRRVDGDASKEYVNW